MTVTDPTTRGAGRREDFVTFTLDDIEISVPKGTLIIRAAELAGIYIPRFCEHPLLDPIAACRQCLVEITDAGNGRPMPKPQPSCAIRVAPGMVVRSQLTSPVADKAQHGQMEFHLINHPLDCPMCDKGGECPLQNQAMSNGRVETRLVDPKRHWIKPAPISTEILLDRERCISCTRCVRFSEQIAGDPFIEFHERGWEQEIGVDRTDPFRSYFSGNTIQICPVGALTSWDYRFRSRPFDLVSTSSVCEHCAAGCALRTDFRRGKVMRRMAGDDPEVNEEWNCDKGRFAFHYAIQPDRLTRPLVRDPATGEQHAVSWSEALRVAARGLSGCADVGVLPGGRVTLEDAYAYAKFARVVLGTNDVDFRARPASDEEAEFLAAAVAGSGLGVRYADLDTAKTVLLAGLEPEEECPILFLRLRKAARKNGTRAHAVAPYTSSGLAKMAGTLVPAAPGAEAAVLDGLRSGDGELATALRAGGAFLLVGERLAGVPGGLSAALRLAADTGARLAWVPRRAGDRGAVDAGCLPGLLPGGRPVGDAGARVDVGTVWRTADLSFRPGRSASRMWQAAAAGDLAGLLVGGVELADLPDAETARAALDRAFVVSLEVRESEVTRRADVVLPVAAVAEKEGTFVDWEGRRRPFGVVLEQVGTMPDTRVLSRLADELGVRLGFSTVAQARRELAELDSWDGARAAAPDVPAGPPPVAGPGEKLLATWRLLLDAGRGQDGEPHLAGTTHPSVVRISRATAEQLGLSGRAGVTVRSAAGQVTLPAEVVDIADDVVWVPANATDCSVLGDLTAGPGARVTLRAADSPLPEPAPTLPPMPNGTPTLPGGLKGVWWNP